MENAEVDVRSLNSTSVQTRRRRLAVDNYELGGEKKSKIKHQPRNLAPKQSSFFYVMSVSLLQVSDLMVGHKEDIITPAVHFLTVTNKKGEN